ncbi:MAG: hypothetical protein Q8N69_00475 [bacterium]|nr:hypothetical protein [bacterium]
MHIYIEKEDKYLWAKRTFIGIFFAMLLFAVGITAAVRTGSSEFAENNSGSSMQGNTVIPVSNPFEPVRTKKVKVVITAYSSTVWQTDDTPFITASGEWVRDGIVANNMLPFGTRITIPEIYGDKTFIVEDRMAKRKGNYHVDIWFPEYYQAKNFGSQLTYIEVLEN